MGAPTTDERQARQARDDGDPEDVVFHAVKWKSSNAAYHDDRDCLQIAKSEAVNETTRGEAKRANRYPCQNCVLGGRAESGHAARETKSPAQLLRSGEVESLAELHDAMEGDDAD